MILLIFVHFKYLIRSDFNSIQLNLHFFNILTKSKCKGFYNFQAMKLKFFLYIPQGTFNKTIISFFYISPSFHI